MARGLERALGQREDLVEVKVSQLERLSGGASRETWSFCATSSSGSRELILQRARPGSVGTGPGMEGEAALLRAAGALGVPVPEVLASGDGAGTVGAPFLVTERVVGETIPRRILRDDRFAGARSSLVRQVAAAAAAIHSIPPEAAPGLAQADQVKQFREILDLLGEPHPAFELGFRWLEEHRPPASSTAVVHGDFRLGNFVVSEGGLEAVLDWELAHLGDPMEDLGWLCVKAWRFGASEPVAGLAPYEELFEAYEQAAGSSVSPEVVRWWEVMGTLKWGVMCIIQASSHLQGLSRSVELAAIGRRTCENEHDLLLLLP